jgi:cell fate regulator YaaT (PSP1 superfamily)
MSKRHLTVCTLNSAQQKVIEVDEGIFQPGDLCLMAGELGEEFCRVLMVRPAPDGGEGKVERIPIRKAQDEDMDRLRLIREREREARRFCLQCVEARGLFMKLVDVQLAPDGSKLIFFYTADERVDFRELVKDLASAFRIRIEMRQIGVRDEARKLGGLGLCLRPLCCTDFLKEFAPITMQMAKDQNLSLAPNKISGICGRLLCCLAYEEEVYLDLRRQYPAEGSKVTYQGIDYAIKELQVFNRQAVLVNEEGAEVTIPLSELPTTAEPPSPEPAPQSSDQPKQSDGSGN